MSPYLKFYSEQFKRDAVALYENHEELSLTTASVELGINRTLLLFLGEKVTVLANIGCTANTGGHAQSTTDTVSVSTILGKKENCEAAGRT